ncbi:leucyl aminopeptidase [Paracoccus fistulariae]|uniref:Probable cytosol aminopeptidase n=1 Tax=Paracoccus fistulariae TaxID=658446 RepID=A0ABY7SFQ2_9RHOB|nr:leucyl aminopeptidase [Paracoccus fistulariae]MDB6181856.1 leucyl aminopeptidase [Paracoccus fistulariae]WCR05855.1 leucyl aminopeptidase [Paracoccus fistulariae]
MTHPVEISFTETATDALATHKGRVALIVAPGGRLPAGLPRSTRQAAQRAMESKSGKSLSSGGVIELAFPAGMEADALMLVGLAANASTTEARKAGAAIGAKLGKDHTLVLAGSHKRAADIALGIALRGYDFSVYRTTKDDADGEAGAAGGVPQSVSRGAESAVLGDAQADPAPQPADEPVSEKASVTFMVKDPEALAKAAKDGAALAEGVFFTRDLVSEPANVLTTTDFADRLKAMEEIGLTVEVLDEEELTRLGMRALLAVGQGSTSPSKVVVMRWNGGGDEAPLALVGKGVVFDSGGISIKPGAGMEEMTMDMGGAGVVAGVLRTLALRRAKANVVGLVGLVENMPDGGAQRPGDIVKSMKGDTIEVINTDAEGRLVLADVLWYAQTRFQPRAVIDLATLTGAVIIALGHDNAGVFSNDDKLADQILSAAGAEGEGAWRLPLGPGYDSLIKSRLADMKNTGGRAAGSITAAQFLQRFIRKDQPWAHIDIAGVAMPPGATDLAPRGATGWGVMTLDRLIRDRFEDS